MSKPTETLDLQTMAEELAQLGGLLAGQVPGLRMVLETVDEAAYRRGYTAAATDVATLRDRVLELQRELGERNMADARERADTTVGG